MSTPRVLLTFILISLAVVLLVLPENQTKKGEVKPLLLAEKLDTPTRMVSIDEAARYVNSSDSNFQFIDIRTAEEFRYCQIPGAINIPYAELFHKNWQGYLNPSQKTNIIYANGDMQSALAAALLHSQGYAHNRVLQGGLNEWFARIMTTAYSGGRLSARENALYGNRNNAKKLFIQINSLPDSLKNQFLEAKMLTEETLDGGCE